MIRLVLTFLTSFSVLMALCQKVEIPDTISSYNLGYGHHQYVLKTENDTVTHIYRSDTILTDMIWSQAALYKRFYPSGELMWSQDQEKGQPHGLMKFYGKDGTHLLTLMLTYDSITDTIFRHPRRKVLFGRFSYSSTVHGGMRRPDGSSNISTSEGFRKFQKMYLVKQDAAEKTVRKYATFYTNYQGYFFTELEKGEYGIFPDYYNIEHVTRDMGTARMKSNGGVRAHWNLTEPFLIDKNFCYLSLHYHSVGYAP